MSELAEPLRRVLGETGYFGPDGRPAASTVTICNGTEPRRGTFKADVRYHLPNLDVDFKFEENPAPEDVDTWQREKWNEGSVPLFWIVEPHQTTLYNGFAAPEGPVNARQLDTFTNGLPTHKTSTVPSLGLPELNARAGFLSMETGRFWQEEDRVNRKHAVDARLLHDMALLESELRGDGLSAEHAQGLIGRTIFAQYLVDRSIITKQRLRRDYGTDGLPGVLEDENAAERLFHWLSDRFNGDMFPSKGVTPATAHLKHVAAFLRGEAGGQGSLFPYRFDLIPVELISAIYEQFVHSADADTADNLDVHYTPLAAVSLIMDEAMQGITGEEDVLDITCGSGVFLVDALRRLVDAKAARSGERTRAMVREALYNQVFGVDRSDAAIQVAAFSLYLAALELDPDPLDEHGLEFLPLRGKTLRVADAHHVRLPKKFDVIVGNPPWSYRGKSGTAARRAQGRPGARSPRGVSFDFANRAKALARDDARFGMVLSATPFFAESGTGRKAAQELVQSLSPLTLIDLSSHKWLFKRARMPAMGLIARYRPEQDEAKMALVRAPWSMAGERGHALDVAAGDVQMLHLASWQRNPALFKSGFVGRLHDHLLLENLFEQQKPLKERLNAIGTAFRLGLTRGNRSEPASFLHGFPFLGKGDLRRFSLQPNLPAFDEQGAERPREEDVYRAPLVLIQENMRKSPRPVVAVAKGDVVYTKAYFGVPLPREHEDLAYLLAGILSSAFAAWYCYMAGPDVGLWRPRIKKGTADTIPAPNLAWAQTTPSGERVVAIVKELQRNDAEEPSERDYRDLDDAVSELYEFSDGERTVIRDGLLRAGWQWKQGRLESVASATVEHLTAYARAFVSSVDPWFRAANERRLCAEVYKVATNSEPLRAVRFVLQHHPPPSVVCVSETRVHTGQVLAEACDRLKAPPVLDDLRRNGEISLSSANEVVIAKPAARRHWLAVNAFADARAVLEESFRAP